MNTEIVGAIFDMIGAEEWKQIKAREKFLYQQLKEQQKSGLF